MADNIRVFCRVRPLSKNEASTDLGISISDDHVQIKLKGVDGTTSTPSTPAGNRQSRQSLTPQQAGSFNFNYVFDPNTDQSDVYSQVGAPVVKDVMEGFNSTVFAYGQTGSGKTFSMMGRNADQDGVINHDLVPNVSSQHGLIPRMIADVFNHIEEADECIEFTIKVSMMEIYMEKIRDLLDVSKDNLKVRESPMGVWVEDLTQRYVNSDEEIYAIIETGNNNRQIACTNMNEQSSRSHSVIILTLGQFNTETNEKRGAKLTLIDLAGSEKVMKTGAEGQTLKEAQYINKSLSALGNVINALSINSTGNGSSTHIPYRDSKLTRMLTDSLGGNSKTTLVVTCSPSAMQSEETLSTLRFGKRAKNIKNKPILNRERSVDEYRVLIFETLKLLFERTDAVEIYRKPIISYINAINGGNNGSEILSALMNQKTLLSSIVLTNMTNTLATFVDEYQKQGISLTSKLSGIASGDDSSPLQPQHLFPEDDKEDVTEESMLTETMDESELDTMSETPSRQRSSTVARLGEEPSFSSAPLEVVYEDNDFNDVFNRHSSCSISGGHRNSTTSPTGFASRNRGRSRHMTLDVSTLNNVHNEIDYNNLSDAELAVLEVQLQVDAEYNTFWGDISSWMCRAHKSEKNRLYLSEELDKANSVIAKLKSNKSIGDDNTTALTSGKDVDVNSFSDDKVMGLEDIQQYSTKSQLEIVQKQFRIQQLRFDELNNKHNSDVKSFESMRAELQQKVDKQETQIQAIHNDAKSQINTIGQEKMNLVSEIGSLQTKISSNINIFKDKESQLLAKISQYEHQIQQNISLIKKKEDEVVGMNGKLQSMNNTMQQMDGQLKSLHQVKVKLEESVNEHQLQQQKSKLREDDLSRALDGVKKALDLSQNQTKLHQEQYKTLRNELINKVNETKSLTELNDKLKAELSQVKTSLLQIETENTTLSSRLVKIETDYRNLSDEIQMYKEQYQANKSIISALTVRTNELTSENSKLQQSYDENNNELLILTDKLSSISIEQDEFKESGKEIESLQTEIESLKSNLKSVHDDNSKLQDDNSKLQEQVTSLVSMENEKSQLADRISEVEQENMALLNDKKAVEEQLTETAAKLYEAESTLSETQSKLNSFETNYNELLATSSLTHSDELNRISNELNTIKQEYDALTDKCNELEKTESKLLSLQQEYDNFKTEYRTVKSSYDELNNNYNQVNTKYNAIVEEIDQVKSDYQVKVEENESMLENISEMKQQISDLNSTNDDLAQENSDLFMKSTQNNSSNDDMMQSLQSSRLEFVNLDSKFHKLSQQYKELTADNTELNANFNTLLSESNLAKSECADSKTMYSNLDQQHIKLNGDFTVIKSQYNDIKTKYDELSSNYEDSQSSNVSLSNNNETMKKKLDEIMAENKDLQAKINSLASEHSDITNTVIIDLNTQNASLSSKNEALETKINEVSSQMISIQEQHNESVKTQKKLFKDKESLESELHSVNEGKSVLIQEKAALANDINENRTKISQYETKLQQNESRINDIQSKLHNSEDRLLKSEENLHVAQVKLQSSESKSSQVELQLQEFTSKNTKLALDLSAQSSLVHKEQEKQQQVQHQLTLLIQEKNTLEKRVETMTLNAAKLNEDLVSLNKEKSTVVHEMKAQSDALNKELSSLKSSSSKLETENKETKSKFEDVNKKLNVLQQAHDSLVLEKKTALDAKSKVTADIETLTKTHQSIVNELKAKNENITKLSKDLSDNTATVASLKAKIDTMTTEHTKTSQAYEVKIVALTKDMKESGDSNAGKLKSLQDHVDAVVVEKNKQSDDYERSLKSATTSFSELETKYNDALASNNNTNDIVTSLTNELSLIKTDYNNKEDEIKLQLKEISILNSKVESLDTTNNELMTQNEQLLLTKQQQQLELQDSKVDITQYTQQLQQLKSDIEDKEKFIMTLETHQSELQAEVDTFQTNVDELNKSILDLRMIVEEKSSSLTLFEQQVKSAEETLVSERSAHEEEKKCFEDNLASTQKQLEDDRGDYDSKLSDALSSLNALKVSLTTEIETLKAHEEDLIKSNKQDISNMQSQHVSELSAIRDQQNKDMNKYRHEVSELEFSVEDHKLKHTESQEMLTKVMSDKTSLQVKLERAEHALADMQLQWEAQIYHQLEHEKQVQLQLSGLDKKDKKDKKKDSKVDLASIELQHMQQLEKKDRHLDKQQEKYIELYNKHETVLNEMKTLQDKIASLQGDLLKLASNNNLKELYDENVTLKSKITDLQNINTKLVLIEYNKRKGTVSRNSVISRNTNRDEGSSSGDFNLGTSVSTSNINQFF